MISQTPNDCFSGLNTESIARVLKRAFFLFAKYGYARDVFFDNFNWNIGRGRDFDKDLYEEIALEFQKLQPGNQKKFIDAMNLLLKLNHFDFSNLEPANLYVISVARDLAGIQDEVVEEMSCDTKQRLRDSLLPPLRLILCNKNFRENHPTSYYDVLVTLVAASGLVLPDSFATLSHLEGIFWNSPEDVASLPMPEDILNNHNFIPVKMGDEIYIRLVRAAMGLEDKMSAPLPSRELGSSGPDRTLELKW